jgi:hypothetical protein
MKNIISRTIAGVLAGIILYFVVDKYLARDKEQPEEVKQQTEGIVPHETQQQAQQSPVEETPQPAQMQSQSIQNVSPIDNANSQPAPEAKQVDVPKPVERKLESSSPQVGQKTVEQDMDLIEKQARAKRDSLEKDKKLNQEVKKVVKKSDDAFDELEKETEGGK